MKVRVRNTAAGPWGLILAGCVGVVPEATGTAMIAARQAEEVAEDAVASLVETATAEPEIETTAAPAQRRRRRHAAVS